MGFAQWRAPPCCDIIGTFPDSFETYPTGAVIRGWAASRSVTSPLAWLLRYAVSAFWSIPNNSGESAVGKSSMYEQQTDREISWGGGRYTWRFEDRIIPLLFNSYSPTLTWIIFLEYYIANQWIASDTHNNNNNNNNNNDNNNRTKKKERKKICVIL